jgi:DNA-directed RNA polymerase specialized sigma subunit
MKYEPEAKAGTSTYELLMQPFVYDDPEDFQPDWELLDIIAEVVDSLSPQDRDIVIGVYYMRMTFEELAAHIGTKAKSHAWRKHKQAIENFKKQLENNPKYIELIGGRSNDDSQ